MGNNISGQPENENIILTKLDEFLIRILCKEIFGPDHELSHETLAEIRNTRQGEVDIL